MKKPLVFTIACLPFFYLLYNGFTGNLTANPIKEITHFTGECTLVFLLLTLSITPLRRLTGINTLIRYRRMIGLFTFFYACLHFSTWLILDHFFDWAEIVKDILKRPYITVGFTAFVCLIPLAITSNRMMVQKLGRNWSRLHRLVYLVAVLGVLHFLWLVKADILPPLIYGLVLVILLVLRLPWLRIGKIPHSQQPARP